ncbi:hypothetical protein NSU_3779 [Novosphingobium pentaromativorans US6-1]|uniref:L,D-TPase catalytic domain-containing protein n=2 Tax=Novosphingobium pentaromativorans TaxID=205844 RepID=G6EHF7_9SPHN|nr:hypothetical protein NSU_3779 [Novosphingobium pentaromativorans US6-1]
MEILNSVVQQVRMRAAIFKPILALGRVMHRIPIVFATFFLTLHPAQAQEPIPWSPATLERLEAWIARAPDDALPVLDTKELRRAQARGDGLSVSHAATELALRLARMHLLGVSGAGQRAGWHIADSDAAVDLRERLVRAVTLDALDYYFAGLQPRSAQYAALRRAFATQDDPQRRLILARNMERWRWLPQSLGQDYVLVNAAAFEAELWRKGQRAGTWPVIVGKRSTPTPAFSARITGVILNPWWVVPASIVREKHGVFPAKLGYVRSGGQIRQKPGPGNALGEVKLDMPNPFTVYIHDTPARDLFAKDMRAFSHGCIRIGDALGFATRLLDARHSRQEVDAIVATRETTRLPLDNELPVYIAYFTAAAGEEGDVHFFPDIYRRDDRIGDPSAGGAKARAPRALAPLPAAPKGSGKACAG